MIVLTLHKYWNEGHNNPASPIWSADQFKSCINARLFSHFPD